MRGMYGGKFKRKLSEVNTRAVSRRQNELVGKFKIVADGKSFSLSFPLFSVIRTSVLSFPRGLNYI